MKKLGFVVLALATALATAPAAKAASFNIDFIGVNNGNTAIDPSDGLPYGTSGIGLAGISGTISGTEIGVTNTYNINSGTVTITIDGITSTASVFGNPTPGVQNLFSTVPDFSYADVSSSSNVVGGGILFKFSSGIYSGDYAELWYGGTGYLLTEGTYSSGSFLPAEEDGYDVAPTPEPSTWLLLGTGLLCMAGLIVRKAKPSMMHTA